ncbi:FUSC family protein [Cupriavidus basilensis]
MASWLSARQWLFSLKVYAAAMLALYIALALALPRPYWAMATVYLVSSPVTGATRAKAAYRVVGHTVGRNRRGGDGAPPGQCACVANGGDFALVWRAALSLPA